MCDSTTIHLETLSFVQEFSDLSFEIEKENFNDNKSLLDSFSVIYNREKEKLPYHINLLDLVKTDENANSRILAQMLKYNENGQNYRVLESFLSLLKEKNPNFDFIIENPKIKTEKDRIDISIFDNNFAIIIENKIHDAEDQPSQLARYIDIAKEQYNYRDERIFVIYLTRDKYKRPEKQSWISPEGHNYKDIFSERYVHLKIRDNILPWLKEKVLPECREENDYFLKSSLNQYIDYLEGIFKSRKIYTDMSERIFEHIKKELELNSENPAKNLEKLNQTLQEINNLSETLFEIISSEKSNFFKLFLENLNQEFPSLEKFDNTEEETIPGAGVYVYYDEIPMQLVLEMDTEEQLYYGIGIEDKKNNDIINLIEPVKSREGFEGDNIYWYAFKKTTFDEAYDALIDLINKTISLTQSKDSFFFAIEQKMKNELESYDVYQDTDESDNPFIGVLINYNDYTFSAIIQQEDDKLYYGVSIHNGTEDEDSQDTIQQILDPVLKPANFIEDGYWYGYKETSQAYAYKELTSLIKAIQEQLNSSQI